jgi:hypothetical protein
MYFNDRMSTIELNVFLSGLQLQPAIKLLDFMRFINRSDTALGVSGDLSSEACGFNPLSTVVAQRVSPTVKELEALSSADASQWVKYWVAVGMFR